MYYMILSCTTPDSIIFSHRLPHHFNPLTVLSLTDYLKYTLIPTLHEGDIVVMDNMRTHHVKEVQTLLQQAGMKLQYLGGTPQPPMMHILPESSKN